jgi:hypothetical protein
MVNILFGALTFIVLLFVSALIFTIANQDKDHIIVKYDCRMLQGNWHPDFPASVVAECKKRIKQ